MSATAVRHRNSHSYESVLNDKEMNDLKASADGNLSFASMLKASPSQQGKVLKLHLPLFYNIIPSFLLTLLQYCPASLNPSWKERDLVILGNYIYRFYDKLSKSIKGSPIPLDGIEAQLITKQTTGTASPTTFQGVDFGGVFLNELPPLYNAVFSIRSIDKTRYYAVQTEEDAAMWVNTIRQGQQECIKRKMGHAEHVPYPRSWEHFDRIGGQAVKRHARIKESVARNDRRETEMAISSFGDGPGARGYYS